MARENAPVNTRRSAEAAREPRKEKEPLNKVAQGSHKRLRSGDPHKVLPDTECELEREKDKDQVGRICLNSCQPSIVIWIRALDILTKKKLTGLLSIAAHIYIHVHVYNILHNRFWQCVFEDEFGCDKRVEFRRTGWTPLVGISDMCYTYLAQLCSGARVHGLE